MLGVERFRERDAWIAWEEGGRLPDVVIEIVSQSTEHVDRGPKMDLYARVWRARAYVIYDPFSHRLDAYELDAGSGRFRPLAAREDGAVPVPPLGLWLGVRELPYRETPGPWLRWIEGDQIVPTRAERVEAEREHAEAERARAEAERDRAVAGRAEAEARLRELEQELARLRRGS